MGPLGWQEIILILLVLLLLFGAKRLPELGRSVGHGLREFKRSISGITEETTVEEPTARQTAKDKQPETSDTAS